jgi:hypothetical protein
MMVAAMAAAPAYLGGDVAYCRRHPAVTVSSDSGGRWGYAPVVSLILLPRSSPPFRPCPQPRVERMIAVVSLSLSSRACS